jgi:mycothiol synthase
MSQLKMEKSDLDNVPQIRVPESYVLRTFREGDEASLGRVYGASDLGTESAEKVRQNIVGNPCFKPERVFVVEHDGEIVATAAGWIDANQPDMGYLHMVGALPGHRGKQLGKLVTVAAINYSRNEGFTVQRLDTDDERLPALGLYLDLGYYPVYLDGTHPGRWETIARTLKRPELLDRVLDLRRHQAPSP